MKYIARSPRIANTFEVKTMKGSAVMAKIAGTESTAKMMSLSSRNSSATMSGVACHRPFNRTRKLCPWSSGAIGITRLNRRTTGFLSGSTFCSGANSILTPVSSRKMPNSSTTAEYCISTEPSAMKMARNTNAPTMP